MPLHQDGKRDINMVIVDDEPLARRRLKALCDRIENVRVVAMAANGDQAMSNIAEHAPDLLLLDVDMPGLSGLDVAELCGRFDPVPQIIFTTAHRKYAVQAFRMEAADYLLKPVKQDLLTEALARVRRRLRENGRDKPQQPTHSLWVQDRDGSVQIRASDIERVEAEGDYMRLCLAGQSYLVHEPMHALESELPKDLFMRIPRSAIVRRDCVRSIRRKARRTCAVLSDGTEFTIGSSYLAAVQDGGLGLSDTVTE